MQIFEIGIPPVCACANEDLVKRESCKVADGFNGVNTVRHSDKRFDIGKIEINFPDIRAGLGSLWPDFVASFLKVADCDIVRVKRPGFAPASTERFERTRRSSNTKATCSLTDKFKGLVCRPVCTEFSHVGEGQVFCFGSAV